jgi:hypothetical protein
MSVSAKLVLRMSKILSDGKYPIRLRLTTNGQSQKTLNEYRI